MENKGYQIGEHIGQTSQMVSMLVKSLKVSTIVCKESLTCLPKFPQLQTLKNTREDVDPGPQKNTPLTQTRHVF